MAAKIATYPVLKAQENLLHKSEKSLFWSKSADATLKLQNSHGLGTGQARCRRWK